MDSGKQNSKSHKKNKNIFTRLVEWVAAGAEKAQKGGGQCTT